MESRIIKFRAWDNVDWKMYEGHSVSIGIGGSVSFLNTSGEWEQDDDRSRIELMQFTGLTDKSGKEIYEGDLLNFTFDGVIFVSNPYYVVFEGGAFVVNKPNFKPLVSDCEFIEVVGNLYDNPELLNP